MSPTLWFHPLFRVPSYHRRIVSGSRFDAAVQNIAISESEKSKAEWREVPECPAVPVSGGNDWITPGWWLQQLGDCNLSHWKLQAVPLVLSAALSPWPHTLFKNTDFPSLCISALAAVPPDPWEGKFLSEDSFLSVCRDDKRSLSIWPSFPSVMCQIHGKETFTQRVLMHPKPVMVSYLLSIESGSQ